MGRHRSDRQRSWWGWGYADEQLSPAEVRQAAAGLADLLGFGGGEVAEPVPLPALRLPPPRLTPPPRLAGICSTDPADRARYAYGRSYRDVVRAFRGEVDCPPDVVARPRDEAEIAALLAWCTETGAGLVPFGGGTSVVGGVEPRFGATGAGAVTLDLAAFDRVLAVDRVSRAARVQAGVLGPALESQLEAHGLTLRFYPQSFEFSTVGGWIATRAAGHFATRTTHIDDLVESVRAVTPVGVWESRRLPGSGAGPSPDRLLLGSEGALGVITEAWLRVRPRPAHRRSVTFRFPSFLAAVDAARAVVQDELDPATCRVVDAREAGLTGAGDGTSALLLLGFEAADRPVDPWLNRGRLLCAAHGGEESGAGTAVGSDASAAAWRDAFLRAPYLRDVMVAAGILVETFETAVTWDRFEQLHRSVVAATAAAVEAICGGPGRVTCRITHLYPDGPAPYFTVLAPATRGEEVAQWDAIKAAADDAVLAAGGTVTHHHGVGRDHRPWYDRQRPGPFAAALRAAKRAVDPAGILNPGVLVDP